MTDRTYNVLFVCTGNSARSIMAECILNHEGSPRFKGYSAGSRPRGQIDPVVFDLLSELDYATGLFRSKSWDEFVGPAAPRLDFVFTVCDNAANETCPIWPGQPMTAHWGVPDPAAYKGNDLEKMLFCQDVMGRLYRRINLLLNLRVEALDRLSLQQELEEIGKTVP